MSALQNPKEVEPYCKALGSHERKSSGECQGYIIVLRITQGRAMVFIQATGVLSPHKHPEPYPQSSLEPWKNTGSHLQDFRSDQKEKQEKGLQIL